MGDEAQCARCKHWKNVFLFPFRWNTIVRGKICEDCRSKKKKLWSRSNEEVTSDQKRLFPTDATICKSCKQLKELKDFPSNPRTLAGIEYQCNLCKALTTKQEIEIAQSNGRQICFCGKELDLSLFADKLYTATKGKWCVTCRSKQKEYRDSLRNRSDEEIDEMRSIVHATNKKLCPGCKIEYDFTHFALEKSHRDGLRSHCKICHTQRTRTHQNECRNGVYVNLVLKAKMKFVCSSCKVEKMREEFPVHEGMASGVGSHCIQCQRIYHQNLRKEFTNVTNKIKSDSGCSNCGFRDVRALDLAHYDRNTKKISSTGKKRSPCGLQNLETLQEELHKVRVLCANCHAIETTKERKAMLLMTPQAIRARERTKPYYDFVHGEKKQRRNCIDCKVEVRDDNMSIFEFDHRSRLEKVNQISNMKRQPFEEIQKEMTKCDLRCANCHRIRTAKQRESKEILPGKRKTQPLFSEPAAQTLSPIAPNIVDEICLPVPDIIALPCVPMITPA